MTLQCRNKSGERTSCYKGAKNKKNMQIHTSMRITFGHVTETANSSQPELNITYTKLYKCTCRPIYLTSLLLIAWDVSSSVNKLKLKTRIFSTYTVASRNQKPCMVLRFTFATKFKVPQRV